MEMTTARIQAEANQWQAGISSLPGAPEIKCGITDKGAWGLVKSKDFIMLLQPGDWLVLWPWGQLERIENDKFQKLFEME